jgi:three-Cys-motif partner protein
VLDKSQYVGREQTYVKHVVLENYLEKLAFKVGFSGRAETLNYVDGFAGPWKNRDEDLKDTSPRIALEQLIQTRVALQQLHRSAPRIRCLFIEKESGPCDLLRAAIKDVRDAEVTVLQGELEQHIAAATTFAKTGSKPFAFIFIDPTGWTGYGMAVIEPLLKLQNVELLINFMTKDISRFVDDEQGPIESFVDLFGDASYRERLRGLKRLDREDAIVETYCGRLSDRGGFAHVGSAIVLNPLKERTHFHLVYASRHAEGLRVFRDVERKAIGEQQSARGVAQQQSRVKRTGQGELLAADDMSGSYSGQLQARYQGRARRWMREQLAAQKDATAYDLLEQGAMRFTMTSSMNVGDWLLEWQKAGELDICGMSGRERKPKPGANHTIRWKGGSP